MKNYNVRESHLTELCNFEMSSLYNTLEVNLSSSATAIERDKTLTEQQRTEKYEWLLGETCQTLQTIINDNPSSQSSLKFATLLKSLETIPPSETLRKLRMIEKALTDTRIDEYHEEIFARFLAEGKSSLSSILNAMEKDLTS